MSRRSTPPPPTSRPRRCGCTSAGAITKARTTTTSRSSGSSTSSSRRGRRRSCSRPPIRATSTNGSSGATPACPTTRCWRPGLIDTCSNYVEHPELIAQRIERFAAIVGARPRRRQHRLRLRHLRRLRQDRPRGRLEEAQGAARRRGHCGGKILTLYPCFRSGRRAGFSGSRDDRVAGPAAIENADFAFPCRGFGAATAEPGQGGNPALLRDRYSRRNCTPRPDSALYVTQTYVASDSALWVPRNWKNRRVAARWEGRIMNRYGSRWRGAFWSLRLH